MIKFLLRIVMSETENRKASTRLSFDSQDIADKKAAYNASLKMTEHLKKMYVGAVTRKLKKTEGKKLIE